MNTALTDHHEKSISIALVEDHFRLREELSVYLSDEGFSLQIADSAEELSSVLSKHPIDIIILDLNLPDEDGISICKRIRTTYPEIGIIILSARVTNADRTSGYTAGADVYLTKPSRPSELTAVIKNLSRRLLRTAPVLGWSLQVKAQQLISPSGYRLTLSHIETLILRELSLSEPYASKEKLLTHFTDVTETDRNSIIRLEVMISRLRTKIKSLEDTELDIKAVRGVGYQLCATLQITHT